MAGGDRADGCLPFSRKETASEIQQSALSVRNEFGSEEEIVEAARPIRDSPIQREMVQPSAQGRRGGS